MHHKLQSISIAQAHGAEMPDVPRRYALHPKLAPVSQISAGVLALGTTEQFALVSALPKRSDYASGRGLGVPAVLLQHQREMLADKFRTRHAPLSRRA